MRLVVYNKLQHFGQNKMVLKQSLISLWQIIYFKQMKKNKRCLSHSAESLRISINRQIC